MTTRLTTALTAILTVAACTTDSPTKVALEAVTAGTVTQTVAAPATVEPAARATATAPANGEIAEIYVRDGRHVRAGEPVLRLVSAEPALAMAQAEAGLDAARALAAAPPAADLSPLLAAVRIQVEEVLPGMLAAVERQAGAVADPAARAAITRGLADARARQRRAARELARAESRTRATSRRASAAQRAAAAAQRAQAEAALAVARAREQALVVVAPIAGVVEFGDGGARGGLVADAPPGAAGLLENAATPSVTVGVRATIGQPLFRVYDLSAFQVAARVDEVDAVLVAAGQPATVLLDAHPERRFPATVSRIGVAPATGVSGGVVYPVTVEFRPLPRGVALRVGMTASVEIAVRRVRSDTVVPARALLRRAGRDVVLVARGGRAHAVRVTLRAVGEEHAAVDGALHAGEQVVVSGTDDLDDGDPLPGG